MSSRQIVYPSFLLFYIALIRFLKDPNRSNIIFLGLATGSTFWVFSYLWQTAVITLGLLFVYTLIRKNWTLMKATLLASVIGGVIGLPTLLYMLWLSHASPYFWESIARFGLVASHLPEAEVIYSGGWIGIALALLIVLYWRVEALRHNKEFIFASIFLGISGFGMWIMEGSNLVTGQLLENGSHMRPFIVTWLAWATVIIAVLAWQHRGLIGKYMRVLVVCWIGVLVLASGYFLNAHMKAFLFCVNQSLWNTQQLYAAPYAWLQANESKSVVVWGNPHDHSTDELPIFTRDFVLYAQPTLFDLVSNQEIQERYLVSNYFDNPTVDDLKNDLQYYVGRGDAFHHAKTVERGIKICRILYFWDKNKDCGVPPTSIDLIGEKLFNDMEQKFQTDIKPNIKTYLKKYNVSYILKDDVLDPQYHPEKLGGVRVYSDGRFEIYKF